MRKRIISVFAGLVVAFFVGQFVGDSVEMAGATTVKIPNRKCSICQSCGGDNEYYCHVGG